MSNRKYWQSFGEFTQSDAHQKAAQEEFGEELLPMEDLDGKGLLDAKSPRRDFLKYLGFSTAAAAVAGCQTPVHRAVPFLNKPDNLTPGVANYFASTYVNGGDAISVVVKQREGRPIKIEGNTLSPIYKGGTSAQAQASVLDLYDPTRLRHPLQRDREYFKEVTTFEAFDKMVAADMARTAGKPIVLLTSSISSPTTLQVISGFLAKYPGSRHVQYDGVSYNGLLKANEASYGRRAIPSYQFDRAKVIVSLGADFLGTWLNPVEYAAAYAQNRKVAANATNPALSRHIQFESIRSMTGSNADDRYTHKPSETGAIALALLAALGGGGAAPNIADARLKKGIADAAAALSANRGAGLVVCGSNDVNVQTVVNAINEAIGANGTTINWGSTLNTRKGVDADMVNLANDIVAGNIGGLFVYDANPVYTYPDGKKLGDAIAKLPLSVSFNLTMDETTERCKYILPSHHWLESWGDAEPKSGSVSFIQPLINPLFKTRAWQSSLLALSGGAAGVPTVARPANADSTTAVTNDSTRVLAPASAGSKVASGNDYEAFHRNYWTSRLGGVTQFERAIQDGVAEVSPSVQTAGGYSAGSANAAATQLATAKAGNREVVFYQKVGVGTGAQANNPWLQELPDPVTKVTWDNYAMVSPALAKELTGLDVANSQRDADKYEVTPEKPVIKVTVNGRALELPVLIMPGVNDNTIGIALGYGRGSYQNDLSKERIGLAATGAGKNAYPLVGFDGVGFAYHAAATAEKVKGEYKLAQTQVHGSSENRPVIYETSLRRFIAKPSEMLAETHEELENLVPHGYDDFRKDGTIYPDYVKPGVKWGMSIDLNTCTGCSACVIACTAENNVPVVGKTEVARAHEMHWLRIDRYFTGDPANPDVVFQPMLCQHCDNAPCENVCPVAATNHSSEGLNQMTYNRCIGTRYCANNCPYKVRRFNWLDYTGSDSFPNNQEPLRGGYLDDSVFQMNDDLPRMVLNPDVTVRSRGVIEKCSFCVQRLQDSKLDAKKLQDPTVVRNVATACSQACPTGAITFGNVNDNASNVVVARSDKNRNFYVMEQLHVLPNVSYLAKVRNTDREIGVHEPEAHGGEMPEHGAPAETHKAAPAAH